MPRKHIILHRTDDDETGGAPKTVKKESMRSRKIASGMNERTVNQRRTVLINIKKQLNFQHILFCVDYVKENLLIS